MIWVNYNMVISNCSLITCEMGLDFFWTFIWVVEIKEKKNCNSTPGSKPSIPESNVTPTCNIKPHLSSFGKTGLLSKSSQCEALLDFIHSIYNSMHLFPCRNINALVSVVPILPLLSCSVTCGYIWCMFFCKIWKSANSGNLVSILDDYW